MMRRWLTTLTGAAAAWVLWTTSAYYFGGARHHAESAWFILTAAVLATIAAQGPGSQFAGTDHAWSHRKIALLLALTAGSALYWPAARLGLFSDDYVLLARSGREILDPSAWEHFRPLPLLVWKAIHPVGGDVALHVLNMTLHALNAWMLWALAVRLGHSLPVAALVATMFLFFPAAVEPVAWASGIFDVSAVFFGLLYLHGAIAISPAGRMLGLAALGGAMLSKETAVALPAIAVLLTFRTRVDRRTIAISLGLAAAYAAFRIWTGADAVGAVLPSGGSLRYAIKELLVRPFATLGAPWTRTELIGSLSNRILLGMLPVATVLALIVSYACRPRLGLRPLTNISWVMLAIAPLARFFFVDEHLEGARYVYLPLCGWSLFVGDLVESIPGPRIRAAAATTLLAASAGLGLWGVNRHLQPWHEAAARRDTLIAEARSVVQQSHCTDARFANVPAEHEGAQLFRNGFDVAVGGPRTEMRETVSACRFVWNGTTFGPSR